MPQFDEHLSQAESNCSFLESLYNLSQDFWDWKVTSCFYISVHLMNAHLARVANLHYRSHDQVEFALNPYNTSPAKVEDEVYKAFIKLRGLSRRARYLVHEDSSNNSTSCHITYSKHFAKSIKNLDILLTFLAKKYKYQLSSKYKIRCIDLKGYSSKHFIIVT